LFTQPGEVIENGSTAMEKLTLNSRLNGKPESDFEGNAENGGNRGPKRGSNNFISRNEI
jgi:hypothetical protein